MPRILVIEDDKELLAVVKQWLQSEKYDLDMTTDGIEGYEYLRQGHYDVIVLDWNVPGMTGVEICRKYRSNQGTTPILIITGKDHISEKEEGLDAGADDYLTKPFNMRELSARLRALARRPRSTVSNFLTAGDLSMDPMRHKLLKKNVEVHVLPKDFALLEFLMRHPDEVFSSESILQRVWNMDTDVSTDAVRTSIKRLRRKLDASDDEDQSIIENVRRVGYRLRQS